MNHADVALTDRHKQEGKNVMSYPRIEASSGCTHFELSNAPGLPARIDFPAFRLETITVTDDCDFCFDSGKLLGEDAAAGEREMSKFTIRTFIRTESDT